MWEGRGSAAFRCAPSKGKSSRVHKFNEVNKSLTCHQLNKLLTSLNVHIIFYTSKKINPLRAQINMNYI
jgi:hypothetical protein